MWWIHVQIFAGNLAFKYGCTVTRKMNNLSDIQTENLSYPVVVAEWSKTLVHIQVAGAFDNSEFESPLGMRLLRKVCYALPSRCGLDR